MTPDASQIEERLPVWEALSDLFLDTELQPHDYEYIARTLAASPYSEQELEDILAYEVYPICKWNLFCVAGVWSGFNREWIRGNMAPRYGKRPFFRLGRSLNSIIEPDWEKVRQHVHILRRE